jgi:hypothetical protein
MSKRNDRNGAALVTALLLGVPAIDLLLGGSASALHAVFAACGAAFFLLWLKEA